MKKILLIIITVLGAQHFTMAQEAWPSISTDDLKSKKYDKDVSAHAVYLNEFGVSKIEVGSDDRIHLNFDYHARIKIYDPKGLDKGTIEIPIHNGDEDSEEVTDITGVTYYTDDDGLMQRATLDPKKVFTVRNYKYGSTMKFALPALRPGCIIEFSYKLSSPYWDNFRKWDFQDDIPKVRSEYQVHIPGFWNFNASLRGSLKLSHTNSEIERDCFSSRGAKCDCSFMKYSMDDIPAFITEDYMTAPKNFLSAIYWELVEFTNPYTNVKTTVTKEWRDVDRQLRIHEGFGSQMKRKELMKDRIGAVIAGKTDTLEKAQAVYAYLQKWFKWNDYVGIYSSDGIKKAYEDHTGSVADINLALAAAFGAAGINAEAVLLSTREHGNVNMLYPVLSDFNYVVIKTTIGNKTYLLDATDPLLAFGLLPRNCLNDKGRVISLTKPSYWIDLSVMQKTSESRSLDLTLLENGKLKGTITNYYSGYRAYEERKAIKKFNSIDEFVENLDDKMPKIKIINSKIGNLDSLNLPLAETYEIEIDAYDNMNHDRLAFNPFLWDKITNNPFKLTERDYPVDWGVPSDSRLILTMHLPAQYTIETPPQVVAFKMPNNGGMFATSFEPMENGFTFSNITRLSKAVYSSEEYPYLKELFNKIILTEKADMMFKKK